MCSTTNREAAAPTSRADYTSRYLLSSAMNLDRENRKEELEDFHTSDAFERIMDWYEATPAEREAELRLDQPPHLSQAEWASEVIRFGFELEDHPTYEGIEYEYPSVRSIQILLLTVGVEVLFNGIALKVDREWFVNKVEQEGDTPGFGEILNDVLLRWLDDLSENEKQSVEKVLEILGAHRNNLVHFGFHQERHNPDLPVYYDVVGYLFPRFFDEKFPVVDELRRRLDLGPRSHPNVEYEWVCFHFD